MTLRQRLNLDKDPIFLMDGSAFVFRSFYANQNMSRPDGFPTNVLFLVLRLLFKILREQSPTHFAFILDGKGKNFRHRLYPEYKAHRLVTPEPLRMQIPPLLDAIRDLGLFLTVSDDCEADDCIAALAARMSGQHPVVIVGADKDLRQCLAPGVFIWDPSGKDEKLISLDSFHGEYGFEPRYWPDYQALVGDSSDNIPGVPGIGPKGANTLMRDFKGLEDIFGRLAAVPPPLRKKLEGRREDALLSRQLTTMRLDCCPEVSLEALEPRPPKQRELMAFMREYDLRSLSRELASMLRIAGARQGGGNDAQVSLSKGFAPSEPPGGAKQAGASTVADLIGTRQLERAGQKARTTDPDPAQKPSQVFLWSGEDLKTSGQGSLLDETLLSGPEPAATMRTDLQEFVSAAPEDLPRGGKISLLFARDLTGDKNDQRLLIGDGETELLFTPLPPEKQAAQEARLLDFLRTKEISVPGLKALVEDFPNLDALARQPRLSMALDLSVAAWLLSPEEYDYSFRRLERLWGESVLSAAAPGKPTFLALGIADSIRSGLKGNNLEKLMRDLEMPLVSILIDMQRAGIGIDKKAFADFLAETEKELEKLSAGIYQDAGKEFNIRSARQLADILYVDLKLPGGRKTTGGQASTSQEDLEKLQGKHPLIDKLLDYRKLEKLRSTYLDPLPRLADSRGRLHTSFNQSSTATGRLSSSNPNLQNIPVRGPQGKRMRACFTAASGNMLVSADYSQIELRVLAHLSQDPTLLDSFRKGEDIHSRTASLLFDLPPDQISPDQRRDAKTINFGLIYGMGPQKLARELNLGMNEAKDFIERYFSKLTRLKEYYDQVEKDARERGYVQTMTGRRRPCPDILSANQQLRSRARRQAINTCIQGSAADIIKLAMLHTAADRTLKALDARLILQIHDELLLECPAGNAEKAGKRLAEIMSAVEPGGQKLSVPLASDWGAARSWADAH